MSDEAAIWSEHEAAARGILERCGAALRSPVPGGMTLPRFKAELARLQAATAAKLGRTREALADRFGPEEARLVEMCGL